MKSQVVHAPLYLRESHPKMMAAHSSLRSWYQQAQQDVLKKNVQDLIKDQMEWLFGYHALQIGLSEWYGFGGSLKIRQKVALECATPAGIEAFGPEIIYGAPWSLPFQSDVFDVIFLPHTLEWIDYPERTWMELYRVLRPQGYVLILGIQPGWKQRFYYNALKNDDQNKEGYDWIQHCMSLRRARRLLTSFGFCELAVQHLYFNHLSNVKYKTWSQCTHWHKPHLYFILAQKQVYSAYLIRPQWSAKGWLGRCALSDYSSRRISNGNITNKWCDSGVS